MKKNEKMELMINQYGSLDVFYDKLFSFYSDFMDYIIKNNIKIPLFYGSLLGKFREDNIIYYDNDIDLLILDKNLYYDNSWIDDYKNSTKYKFTKKEQKGGNFHTDHFYLILDDDNNVFLDFYLLDKNTSGNYYVKFFNNVTEFDNDCFEDISLRPFRGIMSYVPSDENILRILKKLYKKKLLIPKNYNEINSKYIDLNMIDKIANQYSNQGLDLKDEYNIFKEWKNKLIKIKKLF